MLNKKTLKKAQDSQSLDSRLSANKKYSTNDLNQWIFSLLKIPREAKVLDLCCGTGKQSLLFAKHCHRGTIFSLDVSKDSLELIKKQHKKNIKTVLMDLDSIPNTPWQPEFFDLIHCCYGLYYSQKPKQVIKALYKLLRPSGQLVIVGPSGTNNQELYKFLSSVYPLDKKILATSSTFMPNIVLRLCRKLFKEVKTHDFTNQVIYPSPRALYSYLKSSTLYKPKFDKDLTKAIKVIFNKSDKFVITKKAMCIIAKK